MWKFTQSGENRVSTQPVWSTLPRVSSGRRRYVNCVPARNVERRCYGFAGPRVCARGPQKFFVSPIVSAPALPRPRSPVFPQPRPCNPVIRAAFACARNRFVCQLNLRTGGARLKTPRGIVSQAYGRTHFVQRYYSESHAHKGTYVKRFDRDPGRFAFEISHVGGLAVV